MNEQLEHLALELHCPACHAGVQEWCVTFRPITREAGIIATDLHAGRTRLLERLWWDGYREGELAGLTADWMTGEHRQQRIDRLREQLNLLV